MKKWILTLLTFVSLNAAAQVLEEVNFSPATTTNFNTYVTGINNNNFISGYYTNTAGFKKGFVVNPMGKKIIIDGASMTPAYDHISVEGINDSNTVIINATDAAGNITIMKGYYDSILKQYNVVAVSGNGQPNVAKPFAINNYNVYAGWYPNLTERWLFTLNDSSISSTLPWDADRYYNGSAWDPTYVLGNNDADLLCGYVIDGGINTPLVYDAVTSTFDVLPFANQMKIHDINNNNTICGEYKLASGVWCGFYANYTTGAISGFHSITSFFNTASIQSVINGMNDKGEFAGAYFHPTTNTWVGFVFRPNLNEYRMPGFAYATDAWSMVNNNVNASTDVFTPNFYGSFNYNTVDPFAYNGFPLLNNVILTMNPGATLPPSTSVSWKGFAKEDIAAQLMSVTNVSYYENNLKPLLYNKYTSSYLSSPFNGYCFGFSYTALLRKYRDSLFHAWYNMPLNTNLSTVPNTDTNAVLSIERMFLKQYSQIWKNGMFPDTTSYWSGMYRVKSEFLKDAQHTNPSSLGIGLGTAASPTGGHNVLPYKIRTPKKFPFDTPSQEYDTLYVYDSSNANDSTQQYIVLHPLTGRNGEGHGNTSWPNTYEIRFQKPGIRDFIVTQYSALKTDRSLQDSIFNFAVSKHNYFDVKNSSLNVMSYTSSGFSNNCSNIFPDPAEALNLAVPKFFTSDTVSGFTLNTSNYSDSVMQWNLTKSYLCMGITRKALPGETDYSSFNHRTLTYGNPDNVLKKLNCYFIQLKSDGTQATTVLVNNLNMVQHDSILTENPSEYIYKITKISAGATSYDLSTYTFNNDTARQFNSNNIPLNGNSSHLIDGFYGVNQNQTVIYIDNGLNGNFDDTLFVTEVPLNIIHAPLAFQLNFDLYPNPVENELHILGKNIPPDDYTCIIASFDGRIVLNQEYQYQSANNPIRINTSSLANGNYMLFIRNGRGDVVSRSKFAKQ